MLRNQIATLQQELQQTSKKLCACANEKYLVETRLIELEKELYALTSRSAKSLLSHVQPDDPSLDEKSEEGVLSNPRLLPIQEEESPRKQREDPAEGVSAFSGEEVR